MLGTIQLSGSVDIFNNTIDVSGHDPGVEVFYLNKLGSGSKKANVNIYGNTIIGGAKDAGLFMQINQNWPEMTINFYNNICISIYYSYN